jgi:hypothetical protein
MKPYSFWQEIEPKLIRRSGEKKKKRACLGYSTACTKWVLGHPENRICQACKSSHYAAESYRRYAKSGRTPKRAGS